MIFGAWPEARSGIDRAAIDKPLFIVVSEFRKMLPGKGSGFNIFSVHGALAVLAGLLCITSTSSAAPEGRLRLLVLSGKNNHAWQETTPALKKIYENSGRFAVDVIDDPAKCDIATLKDYDAVVSNWTNFPSRSRDWGPAVESAVLDFVRSGGGFVLFHAAGATFPGWPEYLELTGASWGKNSGHGSYHAFNVSVVDKSHPVTLRTGDFVMTDELWHRLDVRLSAHVLCEAYSDAAEGGTGRWEPVAFTTRFGGGRGFYLVLGHDARAMTDPNWQLLMLRGTEWAANGKATIEIPFDVTAAIRVGRGYARDQSREILTAIERLVASTSRNAALCEKLAAAIAGMLASDGTEDFKSFLCTQISLIGTAAEVPSLVRLLGDEKLGFHARSALERIPGEECSRALRESVAGLTGRPLIGVINTIGARRDASAVPLLSRYLKDREDGETVSAAVQALGAIGGPAAARALRAFEGRAPAELGPLVADSLMRCAEGFASGGRTSEAAGLYRKLMKSGPSEHIRPAAFLGYVSCRKDKSGRLILKAMGGTDEALRPAAIQALKDQKRRDLAGSASRHLAALPDALQPQLIYALSDLGDAGILPDIERTLSSRTRPVRLAALFAIGRLGDASSVGRLTELIPGADKLEQAAIRESLSRLPGPGVDDRLIATLAGTADGAVRREIVMALAARDCRQAVPALLRAARDGDGGVRQAALKALGALGDSETSPALISMLGDNSLDDEKPILESALVSVAQRAASPDRVRGIALEALPASKPGATESLLRVLGKIGGDRPLPAVRTYLNDGNAEVRAAAIQALSTWPDSAALGDLLSFARTCQEPEPKALALRGAASLIEKASQMPVEERAAALEQALRLADKSETQKLLISVLGKLPSRVALSMVMPFLHRPEVADEAAAAVAGISHAIGTEHREGARQAVRFALLFTRAPEVVERLNFVSSELSKTAGQEKINIAVITGGHDFDQAPFFQMLDSLRDVEFVHLPQADESEAFEDIADWSFDVIVLYGMMQKISPKGRGNFISLLDKGVGLLALHHASGAFQDWPEFSKITGCRYNLTATGSDGKSRRPSSFLHDVDFNVHVADPSHPVARGVQDFAVHDETYKDCWFSPDAHVVLSTTEPSSDKPLCTVKAYRRANVIYLQPGHGSGIFSLEAYRKLVGQAVRWCAEPRLANR